MKRQGIGLCPDQRIHCRGFDDEKDILRTMYILTARCMIQVSLTCVSEVTRMVKLAGRENCVE